MNLNNIKVNNSEKIHFSQFPFTNANDGGISREYEQISSYIFKYGDENVHTGVIELDGTIGRTDDPTFSYTEPITISYNAVICLSNCRLGYSGATIAKQKTENTFEVITTGTDVQRTKQYYALVEPGNYSFGFTSEHTLIVQICNPYIENFISSKIPILIDDSIRSPTENDIKYDENNKPIGIGKWIFRTDVFSQIYKQDINVDNEHTISFELQVPENEGNCGIYILGSPFENGDTIHIEFLYQTYQNLYLAINQEYYDYTLIPSNFNSFSLFKRDIKVFNKFPDNRIFIWTPSGHFKLFLKSLIVWVYRDQNKLSIKTDTDKNFNNLYCKKLAILGDSISTFGTPDQSNSLGFYTYPGNRCRYPQSNLFTDVRFMYWRLLADKYMMTITCNESWAGSRVSNNQPTDSGDLGPNRCISSQTRINHLNNPDIILIHAGTNDINSSVPLGTFNYDSPADYTDEQIASLPVITFADAYRAMLIRIQKTYPFAKIVVMLPNYITSTYNHKIIDPYLEIIKEACDYFGVVYVDLRSCGFNIFNLSNYLPDGVHPDQYGHYLIYQKLCSDVFENWSKCISI